MPEKTNYTYEVLSPWAEADPVPWRGINPRLTDLAPDEGEINIEDLIANEGVIITLTHSGLLKRTNVSSYRAQRRGGKGVIGMTTKEGVTEADNDFIEHLFTASTHDYLMFFTNTGRVYVERVHEIPDMGRAAKGRSIANLLELKADEKVAALIRILSKTDANKEDVTWQQGGEIFFATKLGTVKKTALGEFANVRKGGIIAITIEPGDTLIEVKMTRGSIIENDEVKDPGDDVILITHDLGVVAEVVRRVAVMYAGRIVEQSDKDELFLNPLHPYTRALLDSVPRLRGPKTRLPYLPGEPPDLIHPPSGCRFHPRCPRALAVCAQESPDWKDHGGGHGCACWNPLGAAG